MLELAYRTDSSGAKAIRCLFEVAHSLLSVGEYSEAKALAAEAHDVAVERLGASHPLVQTATRVLEAATEMEARAR